MEEGANVMIMIGCDFHPGLQELCLLDTETGRRREQRLSHDLGPAPVRESYADLSKPAGSKTRMFSLLGVLNPKFPNRETNPISPKNFTRNPPQHDNLEAEAREQLEALEHFPYRRSPKRKRRRGFSVKSGVPSDRSSLLGWKKSHT